MIERENRGRVEIVTMARGRGNALNTAFLRALHDAVAAAREQRSAGIVLTGQGSIFCAGLDLVELLDRDRDGMQDLLDALYDVSVVLFGAPCPVVAALNGHAIAGGAYLSLCCDARVMAQGEVKWGLNESALGLSLPAFGVEVARYALPRPVLERVLYGGSIYPAFKALDMGVLDQLEEPASLLDTACELVETVSPAAAPLQVIKRDVHAPTLAAMAAARARDRDWLDLWFGEPAQAKLRAARDQLGRAGSPP